MLRRRVGQSDVPGPAATAGLAVSRRRVGGVVALSSSNAAQIVSQSQSQGRQELGRVSYGAVSAIVVVDAVVGAVGA